MKKETKVLLLSFAGCIVFLILMHGSDIGTFHKTSDTMNNLWLAYYLISAVITFAFFIRRKLFENFTLRKKIAYSVLLLMLSAVPSLPLIGLTGYIDYYTTNKQWTTIEVSVADRSGSNNKGSEYSYKLVGKGTVLYLDCKSYFKEFQTFELEICTTNLGNVVAYKK